jgi:hypothetical protein
MLMAEVEVIERRNEQSAIGVLAQPGVNRPADLGPRPHGPRAKKVPAE